MEICRSPFFVDRQQKQAAHVPPVTPVCCKLQRRCRRLFGRGGGIFVERFPWS
jgi:hypothetical protein